MDKHFEIKIFDSCQNLPKSNWTKQIIAYEKAFAVKWYAIFAFVEKEFVGFLRLLRNPDDVCQWYICDVHTVSKYQRMGIASEMYFTAIHLVREYDQATHIAASVSASNLPSIHLHNKLGFVNSTEKSRFADFNFEEDETLYYYWLANRFPAKNTPIHRDLLLPMWISYKQEKGECGHMQDWENELVHSLNKATVSDDFTFDIIWSGNYAIGFVMASTESVELYIVPQWQGRNLENCKL